MKRIKTYAVEWEEYINPDPEDHRVGPYRILAGFKTPGKAMSCYRTKKDARYISTNKPLVANIIVRDNCGKFLVPKEDKSQVELHHEGK